MNVPVSGSTRLCQENFAVKNASPQLIDSKYYHDSLRVENGENYPVLFDTAKECRPIYSLNSSRFKRIFNQETALNLLKFFFVFVAIGLNRNLFVLGLFFGFVFDKFVSDVNRKIMGIYQCYTKTFTDKLKFFAVLTAVSILFLPYVILFGPFYLSATIGERLARISNPINEKKIGEDGVTAALNLD